MGIELGKILPNLDLILYYTRSFYRRLPQPLHPLIHPLGHSSHYIFVYIFSERQYHAESKHRHIKTRSAPRVNICQPT